MYAQSLSHVRLFATPRTVACQTPESPVHGILQARVLAWIAISSSRGSSRAGDRTCVSCGSCIGRRILHHCATGNKWEEMTLKVPSHLRKQGVRQWHRLGREPGDPGFESQFYISGTLGAMG